MDRHLGDWNVHSSDYLESSHELAVAIVDAPAFVRLICLDLTG